MGILGFTVVGIRSGFGDWNGKRTSKGREGWRFGVVGITPFVVNTLLFVFEGFSALISNQIKSFIWPQV